MAISAPTMNPALDMEDDAMSVWETQKAAGYRVLEFDVPDFRAKTALQQLHALSAKAVELGMPAYTIDVGEPQVRRKIINGASVNLAMVPISCIGGPPKLDGWRFVAKIEHDPAGNEVQGYGAQRLVDQSPELFQFLTTCEPNCAHCNLKRQRNTTFLFENENTPGANRIQVGSTCLADFAGHTNPETLLSQATRFADVMDELSDPDAMLSGGSAFRVFETLDVWAAAAALIRVDGRWVSREHATSSGSSADWVAQILCSEKTFLSLVQDVDRRVAKSVQDWLTSDDFDPGTNMYLHNLSVMARRRYVKPKVVGFAGSAVAAWGRNQAKIRQRKGLDNPYKSMWIAKHDEKVDRIVKVEKIIPLDTMYGTTRLHIIRDIENNAKITWFNSGARKFYAGDTYQITGRVKEMGIRDGFQETQLTRVNSPDVALHSKIQPGMDEKAIIKKARKLKHIDARDGDGESLLHVVSHLYRYRDEGKAIILDLIDRGADPSLVSDRDGSNAFDYWVDSRNEEMIQVGLERFPELALKWDDRLLEDYGLEDEPWVPAFKVARDAIHAKQEASKGKKPTSATTEADTNTEATGEEEALAAIRGNREIDDETGERLDLHPGAGEAVNLKDDEEDGEDDNLRLA